jgi:hypothetical protein
MYATRRRGFPFSGLPLFAAGFILASLLGGFGAAAVGALIFVPLLVLKFMFMFFVFGAFMRILGGGFARVGSHRSPHHRRGSGRPGPSPRQPTQEEQDWARARQEARQEIEDLFPDATD